MFGNQRFANGALRWLSVPLLRVGILLIAVSIAAAQHASWVTTAGACVVVISLFAGTVNFVLMRRDTPGGDESPPAH